MKNFQVFLGFIVEVHKFNLRMKNGRIEVFLNLKSVKKQEFWLILCRFKKKLDIYMVESASCPPMHIALFKPHDNFLLQW